MRVDDPGISTGTDLFTWPEVKAYLRLRTDTDQDRLMEMTCAAVDQIEKRTNRILVQRSFRLYWNESEMTHVRNPNSVVNSCPPGELVIPVLPLDLAASSIILEYNSGVSGGVQTWDAYADYYITEDTPHRFRFSEDASAPDFYDDNGDWRMLGLVAGYDDGECPEGLKLAVLTQLDANYNGLVDAERLINNLLGPLGIHGNSF